MSTSVASYSQAIPGVRAERAAVPWTIWAGVLGVTSASVGGAWDVAWHRSIGRDSFLTPAHVAIYLCGIIAALVCGYLILYTTFGHSQRLKAESVHILGFSAPLGAFIAAWGGFAMLTSAPFDNWWHAAYGLDVKIISPPHTLLMLGVRAVSTGVMFLTLAAMNRATREHVDGSTLRGIFLYLGGLLVWGQMFFLLIPTWDINLHRAAAYASMGMALPLAFGVVSRASRSRWACTWCAGFYTAFVLAQLWIFPLVSASPKLGPVYFPVTHLVPAKFPILILPAAFALDILWHRLKDWKPWQIAAVSGVVFIALLVVFEWPFASFLLSKASENRFFGTIYFDYNSPATGPDRMRQFIEPTRGLALATGLLLASVYASVSAGVGLSFGTWMRGVQR